MDRRTLLTGFIKGVGLLTAGVVGIPALVTGIAPVLDRRTDDERWHPLGSVDDYSIGGMHLSTYELPRDDPGDQWGDSPRERGVYVWRKGPEEIVVFSRNCTDLSCPVVWDSGSEWFLCPCHGGIFSKDGEPQAGPPSRGLYRYATRIRNGQLEIDIHSIPPIA